MATDALFNTRKVASFDIDDTKKSNEVSFPVNSGIKNVTEWIFIFSETIMTVISKMAAPKRLRRHFEEK